MNEKFYITWDTLDKFLSHRKEMFDELLEAQNFSDVTLVCDEKHQFKAHKFILSSCSSVFKNILATNSTNTIIFLRGIHHKVLESILEFIYLGETKLEKEKMSDFLNVAKDLNVKEIGGDVINTNANDNGTKNTEIKNGNKKSYSDESVANIEYENEKMTPEKVMKESDRNSSSASGFNSSMTDDTDVYTNNDKLIMNKMKKSDSDVTKNKCYSCQFCDKQYTSKQGIDIHIQAIHENIRFPCLQCDHIANSKKSLKSHTRAEHEGIRFQCKECDYVGKKSDNLKEHMQAKHEGIKYSCQKCDYKANTPRQLRRHNESQHVNEQSCEKEQLTTQLKYSCQKCGHQASELSILNQHYQSKHIN